MLEAVTFAGLDPGPRFLVLGAIHGNERCGPAGIRRVIDDLEQGRMAVRRGTLTFVPVANPRAYAENRRFIERNLNRSFLPRARPVAYEDRLTNALCPFMEQCDYLLDLHSCTAGGPPFASIDDCGPQEARLAALAGATVLLHGWRDAYVASGYATTDPDEWIGTTAYASQKGAHAVLLECGQHLDPRAIDVASSAITRILADLGMTGADAENGGSGAAAEPGTSMRTIRIVQVVRREEGGAFSEQWGNLAPVAAGQKLATRDNGEIVRASGDGVIVLPNPHASAGAEWFYLGVEETGFPGPA